MESSNGNGEVLSVVLTTRVSSELNQQATEVAEAKGLSKSALLRLSLTNHIEREAA
jgi:antitoxin component of RelBE/YafQ-DinJ toxin-antitoxin module